MGFTENYVTEDELFHFTGRALQDDESRYALLVGKILLTGELFRPVVVETEGRRTVTRPRSQSYTLMTTDGHWDGDLEHENYRHDHDRPLFSNILCFADIPEDKLSLHTQKYSQFGLSFSKKFLAERGARPVMYYPIWSGCRPQSLAGATSLRQIEARLREIAEGRVELPQDFQRDFILQFAAFLKPFDVEKPLNDPDNYYMEREWRMLGALRFQLHDIKRLVVPHAFEARLRNDYPMLSEKLLVL